MTGIAENAIGTVLVLNVLQRGPVIDDGDRTKHRAAVARFPMALQRGPVIDDGDRRGVSARRGRRLPASTGPRHR